MGIFVDFVGVFVDFVVNVGETGNREMGDGIQWVREAASLLLLLLMVLLLSTETRDRPTTWLGLRVVLSWLSPEWKAHVSESASIGWEMVVGLARMIMGSRLVFTISNTVRTEYIVDLGTAVRTLVGPFLDSREHAAMNLNVVITESWMMKNFHHVIHHSFDRNGRVLPCMEDARCYVFDNFSSDVTCRLVQNVAEMVF